MTPFITSDVKRARQYETNCSDPAALAIYRLISPYDSHTISIDIRSRPAFLDAILSLLDPSIIQFNKRCTSVSLSDDGKHRLHFSDGKIHESDLIIGADGIRSVTRRYVLDSGSNSSLVFPNSSAYRGLIPTEALKQAGVQTVFTGRPVCFVGSGKVQVQ